MYESHFQLTERPFLALPSTDRYFPAGAIEEARQRLFRCVERGEGPALVIGPPGTGKTLLAAVLANQFESVLQVASLTSGRLGTRRDLLQAILHGLGEQYQDREQGEMRLALIDHLSNSASDQRPVLLLIDEAHDLAEELLDEIRMIADLVRSGQPAVRLVLIGKPQLEEQISRPSLDSLEQRIAARCYLGGLTRDELHQYVAAQIQACGGATLFTDCAIDAIHQATDGVPRLVNQVCDHALVLACTAGLQEVNATAIEEAWADMQQLPLPYTAASDGPPAEEMIEFGTLDGHQETLPDPEGEAEAPAVDPATVAVAEHQIEEIENQLKVAAEDSEATHAVDPQATIPLAVSPTFVECGNPLDEEFDDEEIVIDQFIGPAVNPFQGRPTVSSREPTLDVAVAAPVGRSEDRVESTFVAGHESVGILDPVMPDGADSLTRQLEDAHGGELHAAEPLPPDHEMITVEDEPLRPRIASVRRQEFSQLFAQLRRRHQKAV